MNNAEFKEIAKSAWVEVFPESRCFVNVILGDASFGGYLSKDNTEVANGILENDPLSYRAFFREKTGEFEEYSLNLLVAPPAGSYLCYGSEKIRKTTIKDVTRDKLVKRFKKVREFLIANKDKTIRLEFDINKKLGV